VPEQLNWLIDSVLDPIKARILKMRWIYRAAILLALLGIFALFEFREQIAARRLSVNEFFRVSLASQRFVPFSDKDARQLKASIARLISVLDARLAQPGATIGQAWSTAQVVVAVQGAGRFDSAPVVNFIESQKDPKCSCWEQFCHPDQPPHLGTTTQSCSASYPPHVVASAWILAAYARLGRPAPRPQIQFFLDNQFPDGSWPIYVGAVSGEASTYATALVVFALYEQLNAGLVPKQLESTVRASMDRGRAWLMSHRMERLARWTDYPVAAHEPIRTMDSLGLSGQVLHILHRTGQSGLDDIDREWIRSLPRAIPGGADNDASNREIENKEGFSIYTDSSRYFALPWSIIATADAYPSGTIAERTRALDQLERSLAVLEPAEQAALKWGEYVAAELLIALRYISKDTA